MKSLKNKTNRLAPQPCRAVRVKRLRDQVLARHPQLTGIGGFESGEHVQQGGFAGPRFAEQGGRFTGMQGQLGLAQNPAFTEPLVQRMRGDNWWGGLVRGPAARSRGSRQNQNEVSRRKEG